MSTSQTENVERTARQLLESGDLAGAEGMLREALHTDVVSSDIHILFARLLELTDRADEAIEQIELAISLDSGCYEAHYLLGRLFQGCGDPEGAEYHFSYARKLDPGSVDCLLRLGELYIGLEKWARAREMLVKASELGEGAHEVTALLDKLPDHGEVDFLQAKSGSGMAPEFERVSEFCIGFRAGRYCIADRTFIFVVPEHDFCRACFNRRYRAQFDGIPVDVVGEAVVSLAASLCTEPESDRLWSMYSINDGQLVRRFKLHVYEDCYECAGKAAVNRSDVQAILSARSRSARPLDIKALRQTIFSFGFARKRFLSRSIGMDSPSVDRLLAGSWYARVLGTYVTVDGRTGDVSTTGIDPGRDVAEIKACMEFVERYAFNEKICRFPTTEYNEDIIETYLSLFEVSNKTLVSGILKGQALYGTDLASGELRPIPEQAIYSRGKVPGIMPSTSGFAAHVSWQESLCRSVLELLERDAFIRFWYEPARALSVEPTVRLQEEIDAIIEVVQEATGNNCLYSTCRVLESPSKLPVFMICLRSRDARQPPALCFGLGIGFNLEEAMEGAARELRGWAMNLVKALSVYDGFMQKRFVGKVSSIPDRMQYYSTSGPGESLDFLDGGSELTADVFHNEHQPGLRAVVHRLKQAGIQVYGIDCTPTCFEAAGVCVSRAFSPQLYPLQFDHEDAFTLEKGSLSPVGKLPHCFI